VACSVSVVETQTVARDDDHSAEKRDVAALPED
jgi:hypothetical protein